MSIEEEQLEAKRAVVNSDLARAAEELARASVLCVETEQSSLKATLVAERAVQEANRIQVGSTRLQATVY